MPDWTNPAEELFDSTENVEDLLRMAADDFPVIRSGLKAEMITHALRTQRELRFQQTMWGGEAAVMLFLGALLWWPTSPNSSLAANGKEAPPPTDSPAKTASDSVDWQLVESKNQLRRRNLEILRNAF